jgi:nucleoside-diphosphate-sugar epimerase
VASELAARGHDVLGLTRGSASQSRVGSLPYRLEPVDFGDPGAVERRLAGADAVVHCAGVRHDEAVTLDRAQVFEVNTLGSVRLAMAADRAGVGRFVQISSTAVMAAEEADEPSRVSSYARSKLLAEQLVTRVHGGAVVLRLGWVIDPQDMSARRQLWPNSGTQLIVGPLPVPMIALDDVAGAVEAVVSQGVAGPLDVVAGCPTQAELFALAAELSPRPLRVLDVRSPERLRLLLGGRARIEDQPTWLTRSVPGNVPDWRRFGLAPASWQECVRSLATTDGSAAVVRG